MKRYIYSNEDINDYTKIEDEFSKLEAIPDVAKEDINHIEESCKDIVNTIKRVKSGKQNMTAKSTYDDFEDSYDNAMNLLDIVEDGYIEDIVVNGQWTEENVDVPQDIIDNVENILAVLKNEFLKAWKLRF